MPFPWFWKRKKRYERDYGENKKKDKKKQLKRTGSLDNLPEQQNQHGTRLTPVKLDRSTTRLDSRPMFSYNISNGGVSHSHEPSTTLNSFHHASNSANNYTPGGATSSSGTASHKGLYEPSDWDFNQQAMFSSGATDETAARKYIMLYDYNARGEDDLNVRKNDIVELRVESTSGWWYMKKLPDGPEGYVPANYIAEYSSIEAEEWYFGDVKRVNCELQLSEKCNTHGSFLIRDSETRPTEYSLSVRDGLKVRHYRIKREYGMYCISSIQFETLRKLVEHYQNDASGLCVKLGAPCVKTFVPDTEGLSHGTRDKWEIPRSEITLTKQLGSGNFGEVFEGLWNKNAPVAVKTLKTGTMCPEDFLAEAQLLKELRHKHIIQLYAVCTLDEPLYIIMELMPNGSLLGYLRGPGSEMNLKNQIYIGAQVASGMTFLESKNYIHRDLAARNVLVGENNSVKIADLGLSRIVKEDEYVANGGQFPIKWTAPEALEYNKFSSKSDVWSFGVLLYEIVTHGGKPFPGMKNSSILYKVKSGYRLPKPENCPLQLYRIMLDTWLIDPHQRPTFETLQWMLEDFYSLDDSEYRDPDEVN